ncbi:hypothetical protein AAFF_G00112120, partial [Aldrovandia affinis]
MKAEVERAELLAREAALEEQHSLEIEEVELKTKDKFKIRTSIAASTAKIKVMERFETSSPKERDEINTYDMQRKQAVSMNVEQSPVEYANIGTVPKTPLQRAVIQQQQHAVESKVPEKTMSTEPIKTDSRRE